MTELRRKGLFERFLSCWTRFLFTKKSPIVCKMQLKYQFTMILLIYVRRKDSSDGRAYDFLPSFLLCHSLEGTKIGVGSRLNPGNTAHGHFWASVICQQFQEILCPLTLPKSLLWMEPCFSKMFYDNNTYVTSIIKLLHLP